jgi:hypothetical protein
LSTGKRNGSEGTAAVEVAGVLAADESGAAVVGVLAAGTSSAHAPDTAAVHDKAIVNKARQANRAKFVISSIPSLF